MSEAYIQALVHEHPACLPIAEIDAMFSGPVPICTELNTPAGPIDNFMVTPSGLPVLVECKLWRNPEAQREVVSQILDYAKELSLGEPIRTYAAMDARHWLFELTHDPEAATRADETRETDRERLQEAFSEIDINYPS